MRLPTETVIMKTIQLRPLAPDDYDSIIAVVNDWWGGRNMRDMLPRLFFAHFCRTSFVAECEGELAGFLVGFVSQCVPHEAYIHFAGVHPDYRKRRVGRALYTRFFDEAQRLGCRTVRCVTSPLNAGSIAFHRAMGFQPEHTGHVIEGVPAAPDYDGPGEHRVLFSKVL